MQNTVYKNASIVTGLSIAERGLGFLYRVVLSRLIGAEGLGLYQVALSLFGLFLTVGTGGIPISVSRMITKSKALGDKKGEVRAVSAGFTACLLLSLPICLFLWLFGAKMPFLFTDNRAYGVFRILLIGLCFSCVYAVIRGYFWGNKEFLTPSLIEISEEAVMVVVGVALLKRIPSPAVGAERAAWAVVLSYLFSFTVATICFFLKGGKLSTPKKALKPLFNASMPITSVRASASLITSAVAVLLPAMLIRTGLSEGDAMKLFGIVSGMVFPILFIPSTLIGSLALVLIPELSEDYYRKNYTRLKKNLSRGLRFAFWIACALIPFFFVLGEEMGAIAFSNPLAGTMIKRSCIILLPMSLTMISTSMLNALGFEKQTFVFFFVGAAALLVSVLFLPQVCGAYAYIIGLGASYLLTAVCNLALLYKKCAFLRKPTEQRDCKSLLFSLFSILPLSLFGQLMQALFLSFAGETLSLLFTAISLALASAFLYFSFGLLPAHRKKKKRFFKKIPSHP